MIITGENRTKSQMLTGIKHGYISSKKIARNTIKAQYPDGAVIIRYWDTNVVTINPDKSIVLNSGGFMTKTTKSRIEENTKIRIVQKNNIWYIVRNIHHYPDRNEFDSLPMFYDGIHISDNGTLLSEKRVLPENTIKRFKKDVKKLCSLITEDNIPLPSAGDCYICRFDLSSKKATSDHLIHHVKEQYLHGSLIWLCLELSGYNPEVHIRLKFLGNIRRCLRKVILNTCIPALLENPELYEVD